MQVEPLRHAAKSLWILDDVHHRCEIDAIVAHAIVQYAALCFDVGSFVALSAAEKYVHLLRRHTRSAQSSEKVRTRRRVRRDRVYGHVDAGARRGGRHSFTTHQHVQAKLKDVKASHSQAGIHNYDQTEFKLKTLTW